ncbi:MAG: glycosyltransferase [Verrucomicrobia bacterium]|nr:glycosyltransferase [Verrucomicrobiota bacterium]
MIIRKGKRRWLILSHCYNMDGRAASQTITDKIPFLVENGIEPVIVSASTGNKDDLLEHYQVASLAPSGLKFELRHLLKSRIRNSFLRNVLKSVMSLLILVPYLLEKLFVRLDSHWSWAFSARAKSMKLLKAKKFELIYSTGGANCAHHAAWMLKKKLGLPWIAEIHDPMYNDSWPKTPKTAWSRKLERRICHNADLFWWFTTKAKESALKRNPSVQKKGHVIIPGCECPEFSNGYESGKFFDIGHFGSLHESRNLVPLIKAMASLKQSASLFAIRARLHIYGSHLDSLSRKAMKEEMVEEMIFEHGRLEKDIASGKSGRQQVLDAMRESDLLVLLHGDNPDCEEYIPSKLYEYLWTQRPVLGIIWENPLLEEMLKDQSHYITYTDQIKDISNALITIFEKWEMGDLEDNAKHSNYTTDRAVGEILSLVEKKIEIKNHSSDFLQ